MSNDAVIYSNLGAQLATYRIRESIRKISTGKNSFYGGGVETSLAHKIRADGSSNYAASLNLDKAITALNIAQT